MKKQQSSKCESCPSHSPLKNLPCADLKKIESCLDEITFRAGDVFKMEKNGREGFYCLSRGHWRISLGESAKEITVKVAGPGPFIGYANPNYRATALDAGAGCFVERESFEQSARASPEISKSLIEILCETIAVRDERIADTKSTSAKIRVLAALLTLDKKFGRPSKEGSLIDLRLSRETIASLAGTVVETVARALAELEADGLIHRDRREIYISNRAEAERLVRLG